MNAIVTVIGDDKVGIIASVCTLLAQNNVNILDITQGRRSSSAPTWASRRARSSRS